MTGPFATRLFRICFALAGCYNLAFGLWAGVWPLHFFELFEITPPRYPGIWACLGMVVGVYGLLYWHAAWKPHTGRPIIAIGLLGKVLGPVGMVLTFSDAWPRRLGMLCVYNDLIWWLPFALFLLQGTSLGERTARLAPWMCAALHALALVVMAVFLQPGMLTEPITVDRATYIATHNGVWELGWALWMLSALSLVGFYAWWGSRLSASLAAVIGVLLAAFGSVCDLSGEMLSVLVLVERAQPLVASHGAPMWDAAAYEHIERIATLLTAGAANGLYTLGGLVLMLATPDLPKWVRGCMGITWAAGAGMTIAALAHSVAGMVATTTVLFPLLIVWIVYLGYCWRRP